MQVTRVNNTYQKPNFGKFIKWVNKTAQDLNYSERVELERIKQFLDQRQSNFINIIGEVADNFVQSAENKKVRFITLPLLNDLQTIRKNGKPNALLDEYKRYSKWFPLNNETKFEAKDFINRQIGYLKVCVNDPNHNASHITKKKK